MILIGRYIYFRIVAKEDELKALKKELDSLLSEKESL